MLFFERILKFRKAPKEQRRASRYAIGSAFPMKAVLNLVGRDEYGELLESSDGQGWNWMGRLVNFSVSGVSMQLPPATAAHRGDSCVLVLSLAGYQLNLPCHVAQVRTRNDSVLFGLKFDFADAETQLAYRQLLELVAFGASLKREKAPSARADASGYFVEHYRGDFESHLTVWRGVAGGAILWFEFQLARHFVRGSADTLTLEFASGQKKNSRPVPPAQVEEIRQLFRWVVPNIARAIPADVRHSLEAFAT
jgi:hypothetical protein